ncbi:MAG: LPS-assembly protein LptD [Acidobacteria bacterium]|nr:LPS-assembly protein LptD [Acidobacteriota bacterium]
MIFRYRIIITALSLCHLLLVPGIVTSQTPPPAQAVSASLPAAPSTLTEEEVTIHASQQEYDKGVWKLRGQAEVHYRNYVLYADEITYNSATGDTEVEGHVVLDGGPYDEHVEASHGIYNVRTQVGTLYDVIGTAGFRLRRSGYILTTSNPFAFTGKVVEKHGPDHYLVRQGTVTTCELPRPKWQFEASRISVDVDGTAKIYNSSFRLGRVPVFYFPFVTHPIQKQERQSGFLIPSIGNSSRKGKIVGESVYLALNRSMDLTLGAEYYSKRGWSQRGEFRARPSDTSYVDLSYFGVLDRGIGDPHQDQGGEDAHFTAEGLFGHNFRGVANVDYLSSFVFRIAFTEVYSQAVNSEVKSQIFLSNTTNGFHYNLLTERYQNYEVCNPDNPQQAGQCTTLTQTELIRILHTPSFFLSGEERQVKNTPFYWSFQSSVEGLQRRDLRVQSLEPLLQGFRTAALVGRFDFAPSLSMPFQWKGWSARAELTLRDTAYTQTQLIHPALEDGTIPTSAEDKVLNRKSLEASFELRPPALSRVFEKPWLGRKWKHVIEPRLRYDYVTGVDNFTNIIRFDASDILSNTNNVEYSVVNRVYAKRIRPEDDQKDCEQQGMDSLTIGGAPPSSALPWESSGTSAAPPCAAGPREVLTWEIGQKYYFDPTFGHALVLGQRNVFTSTADFTGIGFLSDMRRFSPIISRLRVETSPRTNTEWDLDYDFKTGRINASTALVNFHYGLFTVGGGDAFLRVNDMTQGEAVPGQRDFHQFRFLFGYGQPQKRGFSGASSFGFDHNQGFLQYSTAQLTYNWDCCGFSVEYRRFALGLVRNENQFRFAFSLANVGAFGNLKRHERLY